jgi:hypothetical protein
VTVRAGSHIVVKVTASREIYKWYTDIIRERVNVIVERQHDLRSNYIVNHYQYT